MLIAVPAETQLFEKRVAASAQRQQEQQRQNSNPEAISSNHCALQCTDETDSRARTHLAHYEPAWFRVAREIQMNRPNYVNRLKTWQGAFAIAVPVHFAESR